MNPDQPTQDDLAPRLDHESDARPFNPEPMRLDDDDDDDEFYGQDIDTRLEIAERSQRGEQRHEALCNARKFFTTMIEGINNLPAYNPEHPHIQETAPNGLRHLKAMIDWELKCQELLNARVGRTTITQRCSHVFGSGYCEGS